jgi:hypothetical protein
MAAGVVGAWLASREERDAQAAMISSRRSQNSAPTATMVR